jgi:hypothetical protein
MCIAQLSPQYQSLPFAWAFRIYRHVRDAGLNTVHLFDLRMVLFTSNCTFQVSHAGNYLEKQGAFIEEINAKIWAIDGTELPDARSAAKEAVEVQLQRNFFRSRNIMSSVVHELQVLGGVQESLTGTGLVKPLRS